MLEANQAALDGTLPTLFIGSAEKKRRAVLHNRFGVFVDGVLRTHKLRVDEAAYEQLLEHVGRALTDAAELLLKRSMGDYSPDQRGARYPEVIQRDTTRTRAGNRLTFTALIAHKDKTQSRSANTVAVYQSKLRDFAGFIGHDDARRVTKNDVRRWRDSLLERGLAKKTINDQYLAAIKSVLSHGVKEFDLPSNPADRIRDERNDPAPKGSKGYSDEQARAILSATFNGCRKNVSLPYRRAIFWAPWICAYTGLRVGEVTQLQGSLLWDGQTPYLIIRPEDGSTKGGNAWTTGIHQHLIDLGLLDMFRAVGDGPAFYAPYAPGTDMSTVQRHRSKDAADRVAKWVREEVGIEAPLGRPNHAWRHSFTTISRQSGMGKEARDYMMGSRSQTDAREGYGDWSPAVVASEINKMPRFDVAETDWRPSTERVPPLALRGSTPTKRVRRQPNRRKRGL